VLQAERSPIRVPDEVDFFNLPNASSHSIALGSTQPLTEMSTRNLPGGKKRPARRADEYVNMWEPQPLATLRASTAYTEIKTTLSWFPHVADERSPSGYQ
jgi:hypothetical protein